MLSLIICTRNRSESLRLTLQSVQEMKVPAGLAWELIVVDNGSRDNTREVFTEFAASSEIKSRYTLEQTPGVAHARNRGIAEAEGEIISFTDDDVFMDQNWLARIADVFATTGASCVGGRILLLWEASPPKWLGPDLFVCLGLLDLGSEPLWLDAPTIWGGNLSVLSAMFEKYGGFDTTLGRKPGKLYSDEESEFVRRMLREGERVYYSPDIRVFHRVPLARMNKSYFRKLRYDKGELDGIQRRLYDNMPVYQNINYSMTTLVSLLFKYFARLPFSSRKTFRRQLDLCQCFGYLQWVFRHKARGSITRLSSRWLSFINSSGCSTKK